MNSNVIRKNRIVTIAMALIFISAFVFLFLPTAHAGIGQWIQNALDDLTAMIMGGHGWWIADILLNTQWTDQIGLLDSLIKSMQVIGMALVLVYVLIEIVNDAKNGKVTLDLLFRAGIKLVLAGAVILYANELIVAVEKAMFEIVKLVSEGWEETADPINWPNVYNPFKFILNLIVVIILRVILLPLSWIIELIIKIQTYSLLLEVSIRKVFIPISLATVVQDGERGPGVRYIKKFAALYIKMAILITAFYLAGLLPITVGVDKQGIVGIFDVVGGVIIMDLAALAFTSKASALANEVMGA